MCLKVQRTTRWSLFLRVFRYSWRAFRRRKARPLYICRVFRGRKTRPLFLFRVFRWRNTRPLYICRVFRWRKTRKLAENSGGNLGIYRTRRVGGVDRVMPMGITRWNQIIVLFRVMPLDFLSDFQEYDVIGGVTRSGRNSERLNSEGITRELGIPFKMAFMWKLFHWFHQYGLPKKSIQDSEGRKLYADKIF